MEDLKLKNPEPDKSFEEQLGELISKADPYINILWEKKKRLLIFNSTVLILLLIYLLVFVKPFYESTVTILPEYGNKSSTFSGLAELASLAGATVGAESPIEIYQNLITSEAVLGPVIFTKYRTLESQDSVNLLEYFKIEPEMDLPVDIQKRKMFIKFYKSFSKSHIVTDVDRETKILDIKVTMPESKLAAAVANNIVESLDRYVMTKRKSYASNQSFYIEVRIGQVKDSLQAVEEKLKVFRMQNKVLSQSPELMLQEARLSRNVEILQTVYVELTKQFELAKIDEIKDTPVLNVKEYAQDPVIKAGPGRSIRFIFLMMLSVFGSCCYYLFFPQFKRYYRIIRKSPV
jgi:capsular polysaccharide biosynthesis protein